MNTTKKNFSKNKKKIKMNENGKYGQIERFSICIIKKHIVIY